MRNLIKVSEKSGTGGVQPHNAILKGELIDRVRIKYQIKSKGNYPTWKVSKLLELKMYTSATVWEFKAEVAKALGLAPKYAQFMLPNDKEIQDT